MSCAEFRGLLSDGQDAIIPKSAITVHEVNTMPLLFNQYNFQQVCFDFKQSDTDETKHLKPATKLGRFSNISAVSLTSLW